MEVITEHRAINRGQKRGFALKLLVGYERGDPVYKYKNVGDTEYGLIELIGMDLKEARQKLKAEKLNLGAVQ